MRHPTGKKIEGHKITGTTVGLVTVPELHTIRTALLLNQNMPTHTRDSLSVLRSILGKINGALRYCGEEISDISVRTEPRPMHLDEKIAAAREALVALKQAHDPDSEPELTRAREILVSLKQPPAIEVANIVTKAAQMESRRADAVISALTEKPKPISVTADSKKEATKEKRERLGVQSKKKVRDDWD